MNIKDVPKIKVRGKLPPPKKISVRKSQEESKPKETPQ